MAYKRQTCLNVLTRNSLVQICGFQKYNDLNTLPFAPLPMPDFLGFNSLVYQPWCVPEQSLLTFSAVGIFPEAIQGCVVTHWDSACDQSGI